MQLRLVNRKLYGIVEELDTELKKPVVQREITAAELKQLADDFQCLLGVDCKFKQDEEQDDIDEAVEYLVDKHAGLQELKIRYARLGERGWSSIQNLRNQLKELSLEECENMTDSVLSNI